MWWSLTTNFFKLLLFFGGWIKCHDISGQKKKINNQKEYKPRSNAAYQKERNSNLEKNSSGFLASKEENDYSELFKLFEDPGDDEYFEKSEENSFQNEYYLFLNEVLNDSKKNLHCSK